MKKKLIDLYPIDVVLDTTKVKIFDFLATKTDLNSFITGTNASDLNLDYYMSHSGDKYLSRLTERLLDHDDDISHLSNNIGAIVYQQFKDKWINIYNALTTAYNPLENYSMDETTNVKTNVSVTRNADSKSDVYGFNSEEPSPSNETSGGETTTTTGLYDDNEEHHVRSGNIGVTTSQQMLESEIEVRQYNFYREIMNDIDSVLCLGIY